MWWWERDRMIREGQEMEYQMWLETKYAMSPEAEQWLDSLLLSDNDRARLDDMEADAVRQAQGVRHEAQ